MRVVPAIVLAGALLAGCAATGPDRTPPPAAAGLPLSELPAQNLQKGQCAMFLWARTTPPRRVFMALHDPAMARIVVGTRTLDLPRTGWSGEASFGHYPEQRFAGPGFDLRVSVQMDARPGLSGGAVVPSGLVEYRDNTGAETLIPVAGMVACQD